MSSSVAGQHRHEGGGDRVEDLVDEELLGADVLVVVARAQVRQRVERAAMDRDHGIAGDDHVDLAQQRPAGLRARVDAEHDHEHVAVVLLDLRPLAEGAGVLDGQRVQADLLGDLRQILLGGSSKSSQTKC